MAVPASKRRKLEHTNDAEDDGDASSFASYEEENVKSRVGLGDDMDELEGSVGGEDAEPDQDYDEDGEDEEQPFHGVNTAEKTQPPPKQASQKTPKITDTARKRPSDGKAFTSGSLRSSMFKLQVDELLDQIRPRHGKREVAAEAALHKLKSTIDDIPARGPLSIVDAEKRLLKTEGVTIPFPTPPPPKDAKYKLEYQKPANINVAGSHALKTASRTKDVIEIDMVLTMPSDIFQDKDYLNFRYFYKRAYYLARVAAGLKSAHDGQFDLTYANFRGNRLHPVIVVTECVKDTKKRWQVNIMAGIPTDIFSSDKLLPEKICVRGPETAPDNDKSSNTRIPTPLYNSSIRADMMVTPYLKLLHSASKSCEGFRDACLLGSTWFRQRGFMSDAHYSGFGNFEWCALTALMLAGGGSKGTPILSAGYSSYQLFKATLQVLAMKDLSKHPFVIGAGAYAPKPLRDGSPIVWDTERSHNLLYKMTPWAYKHLRQEARTTLNMLGDQQHDGFDATFILRSDGLLYRYDCILKMFITTESAMTPDHLPFGAQQQLFMTLQKGLGDRASHINIIAPRPSPWAITDAQPNQWNPIVRVGLVVNPETAGRTVDHGPSAEEKSEAASFRKFWGEKAELRRFKDGSIMESLVWSANEGGQSVLEQIIRFVVKKHVAGASEASLKYSGDSVKKLVPQGSATAQFQGLAEAYKQMESDVRGLEGLPLSIRQITPADTQLRSACIQPPMTGSHPMPADVVIQFEGSGRWPDDLEAIQRTKIAFLLKLSELLQDSVRTVTPRIGLENQQHTVLNQAHLDLVYDSGAAFRMRIYHDREKTLFERQLKDKSLDPRSKEIAALGLAKHKRDYLKAPAHTQAIARLCSRHPALSGTIRLVKKWFASHLLFNHIADELIELLVAKTFVQPWPWQTPSSVHTGFLRTLFFLSRWEWRADPLIVDLSGSGDLKSTDVQAITTKFEAWRNIDPSLNRVVLFAASNVDHEGTTWTDGRPAKVVAGRMTSLAKAACAEVKDRELELEPAGLFASPLGDFDFVLHLDPELIGKRKKARKQGAGGFKNLEMDVLDDTSLAGFDPVNDFLQELETLFGAAVVFFSGGKERAVIAGLWNPQTKRRPWKLNLAYSTVPVVDSEGEAVEAEVNKEGILAEIARLSGDMVERVEVR